MKNEKSPTGRTLSGPALQRLPLRTPQAEALRDALKSKGLISVDYAVLECRTLIRAFRHTRLELIALERRLFRLQARAWFLR